jgi:hypothetical protein
VKKLRERLDLKQHLPPGYVEPWVFRGAIIAATLLLLGIGASVDPIHWKGNPTLSCPEGGRACVNTFHACMYEPALAATTYNIECPRNIRTTCNRHPHLCAEPLLVAGTSVGVPAPQRVREAAGAGALLLFLAFPINHLLYRARRKLQS